MNSPEQWPPAPTPYDRHQRVPIYVDSDTRPAPIELRMVRLWGRQVLIDPRGDVWCEGCLELVPVSDLARRDNRHRPGLSFRAGGEFVTSPDEGASR